MCVCPVQSKLPSGYCCLLFVALITVLAERWCLRLCIYSAIWGQGFVTKIADFRRLRRR
ncbi:transmembrane protein, putative [Medicago truncatula]|uniref:Transmembrane protein, putative n=1 Tax=Medicago truncatula TaxID=3880 RepID=A0A072TNQ3_MEDTR|nr:transmembrane protein, putative [Medicago truncatula]